MKNILHEKPNQELVGRLLASVYFVSDDDVKDKDVLNVGCGFGWCELNFLDRGVKQMIGIEISEEDLKTAKENVVDTRVSFKVGSAIQIPFPDDSFDTVVSWEVIEHIPKGTEKEMFSEVCRVLKPNGIFYLSTPYHTFFSDILDPAWWITGHRHYSLKKLTTLAVTKGFTVDRVEIKGGWWTIFSILHMYIAKWIFRKPSLFGSFFSQKEHKEYMMNDGFADIFVKFKKNKE